MIRAASVVRVRVSGMFIIDVFQHGSSAGSVAISRTVVACVSMVRAASEDRMQQHRGQGQRADEFVEHLIHRVRVSDGAFVRPFS